MRFVPHLIIGLVALAPACSSSGEAEGFSRGPSPSGPSQPGNGVLYEGETPLTLAPGERKALSFIVTPPGEHTIRFALTGDSGDASLDADLRTSSPDGRVSVELKAPSSSRTFTVRASLVSGSSAEVPVSVSGLGFGSIEVVPSYSGKRVVERWIGTVATGTSCAELLGIPPPDGPLTSQARPPKHPVVNAAPVGPALVVTVRAGQFAGGCMDVKGLAVSETKRVSIPVLDRPLSLAGAELSVTLGFDPEGDALLGLFESASETAALAFATADEAESLLDAMSKALPSPERADFDELRTSQGWDARVSNHLETKGLSLRGLAEELLSEGVASLSLSSGLRGRLVPASKDAARLVSLSLFELPSSSLAMAEEASLGFSAAPDDIVHLGGEVSFSPTALVSRAALDAALRRSSDSTSVAEALAASLSCDDLAWALDEGTPDFAECDALCLAHACKEALSEMWKRASDEADLASFSFTASGDASVGDEAEITGFAGSWVGSITHGALTVPAKGKANGKS